VANDNTEPDGSGHPSYKGSIYTIALKEFSITLSRKFPPASRDVKYNDIASVEHIRIIDYSALMWTVICAILWFSFSYVDFLRSIVTAMVDEINLATGSTSLTTSTALIGVAVIFVIAEFYYFLKFAASLPMRLVIYRPGRNPIAIPLPQTQGADRLIEVLNKKVSEASGLSKSEVEKLVTIEIKGLLDQRARMQEEFVDSLKKNFGAAKTKEEKARAKQLMQEGLDKLKVQDEAIDKELLKTGLSKDDLFKKYRIKPPTEDFIKDIIAGGG